MIKEIENFTGYYIEDNGTVWSDIVSRSKDKIRRE